MPGRKALSVQPLYLQVRDLLLDRISTGIWKPGASVPNEQEIARDLGVSSGTVRKALDTLEQDRLIVRRRGRGTFVIDQSSGDRSIRFSNIRDSLGRRVTGQMELIEQTIDGANEMEQERLRLRQGEPVLRTIRVRRFDAQPYMYEECSIALNRIPGFDGVSAGNYLISAIAQKHGVHLSRARERLTIVSAATEVAERLGVPPGTHLIQLDRVIFAMNREALEWRIAQCNLGKRQYYATEMS